ncbi:MAG: primosomal protein N' [Gemmatimonadota bacterium]
MRAEDSSQAYCRVALPRPVLRTFLYAVPARPAAEPEPGMRVLVPFGRRRMIGLIDSLTDECTVPRVRAIIEVLDKDPVLPGSLRELCRWVADYYVAPLGMVVKAALPPGLLSESAYRVYARPGVPRPASLSRPQIAILDRLATSPGGLRATALRDVLPPGVIWPALRSLRDAGLVEIVEELPRLRPAVRETQVIRLTQRIPTLSAREDVFGRARRQREAYEMLESLGGESTAAHLAEHLGFSRSVLSGLVRRGVAELVTAEISRDPFARMEPEPGPSPKPTPAQREVIRGLLAQSRSAEPGVALLRGVTGSGKTLVYLELLEEIVGSRGKTAIVLVPEIALTPQTVARFRTRFGDRVAVLHSALSPGERHDEWTALREGRKQVAIGARSAVFAPVRNLGAIVLDEEHEGTFKQSDTPRYHARAVATVRARLEGALCLLGSATPSLESWANATSGRYRLYELGERVTANPLPEVRLIDLREARTVEAATARPRSTAEREPEAPPAPFPIFSDALRTAMAERLSRGEQVILLLNRRGYATFVQCGECGEVWSCHQCNVSLTYHRRRRRIVCHHCGYEAPPPDRCFACGAPEPRFTGVGTEQVERRLGEIFPRARLARMDVDTTGTKWAHFEILERVRRREVDILLGTQMIAKGLDFPHVTLVGVVNADVSLNLPDFRASERTFQLLAQVAGRAGRGAEPGQVLVQTSRTRHFALLAAAEHDYLAFAERELADRAEPGYPPHRRLANLIVSGPSEDVVAERAGKLAELTRDFIRRGSLEGIEVIGPAPCPIDRLRGRWRWHYLVRADRPAVLGRVLRYMGRHQGASTARARLEIDRDPEGLM